MSDVSLVSNDHDLSRTRLTEEEVLLFHRSRKGDSEAFTQLFRRRINRALRSFDEVDVIEREDLEQEVFLNSWARIRKLRDPDCFHYLLYGLARNIIKQHKRLRSKEIPIVSLEQEGREHELEDPHQTNLPDQAMENQEIQKAISETLDSLSEREQAVYQYIFVQEVDQQKAAELLNVSKRTVQRTVVNLLLRLRQGIKAKVGLALAPAYLKYLLGTVRTSGSTTQG